MLAEIRACTPMQLTMASGEVVDVIIYRIKDNSSQQERTDKGELSHVMNINFFIDGPQVRVRVRLRLRLRLRLRDRLRLRLRLRDRLRLSPKPKLTR